MLTVLTIWRSEWRCLFGCNKSTSESYHPHTPMAPFKIAVAEVDNFGMLHSRTTFKMLFKVEVTHSLWLLYLKRGPLKVSSLLIYRSSGETSKKDPEMSTFLRLKWNLVFSKMFPISFFQVDETNWKRLDAGYFKVRWRLLIDIIESKFDNFFQVGDLVFPGQLSENNLGQVKKNVTS